MNDYSVKDIWAKYYETRDEIAKNKLIEYYLPLVKSIALRISGHLPAHADREDLYSVGVMGLISSVEKFNIHSGNKFKTFAHLRIYGAMMDELRSIDWVPRSVRTRIKKIQTAHNVLQQEKNRFPLDEEVADFLGVDLEEYDQMIESTKIVSIVSLDSKIYRDKTGSNATISDFVYDQKKELPIKGLYRKELKQLIIDAINALSKQEKIVLTLYYYEEMTLKEIGEVLNVSESRVCQIHSKALYKLKAKLSLSEVSDYATG